MCHFLARALPCATSSVAEARHAVVTSLCDWGVVPDDLLLDDAALVTSELVTNATRFCLGSLRLDVLAHRDHLEVGVEDDSVLPPVVLEPAPGDLGGRGLPMLAALSEEWGYHATEGGKRVWARLQVPVGSPLGRDCRL